MMEFGSPMEQAPHLKDQVTRYWESHENELKENYPGIRLKRLMEEAERFSSQGREGLETFFLKLNAGVPLEYITGRSNFYQSEFLVTPEVLIPRSETEILVEKAVEILSQLEMDEVPKVADIGTGTGAILLSLLSSVEFRVDGVATDISEAALEVAKKNYFLHRFSLPRETQVRFMKGDRLDPVGEKFHLIVSNPPYIKKNKDKDQVHSQVLKFEPHLALFLNDEQYDNWFDELFLQVKDCLYPGGTFLMEGHEDHLSDLKKVAEGKGFEDCEVLKDYTQRDRFLIMKKAFKN